MVFKSSKRKKSSIKLFGTSIDYGKGSKLHEDKIARGD